MKSIKHRALSLFLVFITIFEFCGCSAEASEIMRNMTTAEIVRDMGHLGNTLESCGDWIQGKTVTNYETAWGSPVITEDMIKGYKNAGFDTLRVPVAWSNLRNDKYDIDPGYMDRVDMFCY